MHLEVKESCLRARLGFWKTHSFILIQHFKSVQALKTEFFYGKMSHGGTKS